MKFIKNTIFSIVAMLLLAGTSLAQAASLTGEWCAYDSNGNQFSDLAWGGTTCDTTITGDMNVTAGTLSLSTSAILMGLPLGTFHDAALYGPGSHSIDTVEGGTRNFTVGAGQLASNVLWDWNVSTNMDILSIWDVSVGTCMYGAYAGSGTCTNYTAIDGDGDGVPGIRMVDGPFYSINTLEYFSMYFNLSVMDASPVPVPAAFWLFGSGLATLLGFSRRKKK